MKKFTIILLALATFYIHSTLTLKVKAVSFEYEEYNVTVDINTDSSFEVKEEIITHVYGEFHGLRRDLTLADPRRDEKCSTTSNLYCGGFDRVVVNSIKDLKGNDITEKVKLYRVDSDNSDKQSLRFEWEIFPDGKNQNGELFGWTLDYTIFGGIADVQGNPYFYWNMLPEDRSGVVSNSTLKINLPTSATFQESALNVYSSLRYQSNFPLTFKLQNLPSYSPFTVSYKFSPDEISLPGQISYSLAPAFGSKVFLDGIDITDQVDGVIKSVPVGNRTVRFEHVGYETIERTIKVESGKTAIIEANLSPSPWMQALLLINNLICLFGCLLIPAAIVAVYLLYRRKGRDENMPKTIIPLFNPPKNTSPYMVGSIIDEKVDKQDVVGTIIDLAYRGYIKIKEIKKDKNYELTKLGGKPNDPGLNSIEQRIFDALFTDGDVVETQDLGKTFPMDYLKIQSSIYKEMVSEGYFNRSPVTTIGIYVSIGIVLLVLGGVCLILFSIVLIYLLGIITVFTPGLVLIAAGIAFLFAAKFMPAKTAKGSKLYADILGFKMYMNTAEKYTVQKLEPENFVKFLSFAIVFGIEKAWAKKFEGIYKGSPEWFEGSGGIYDAFWISSFTRSFSNSTVQSMTPISTGSSSGSGWSGGGSFGGFSGGGGGGGSSGGW